MNEQESFIKDTPKLFKKMYQGLEEGDAYMIKRAAHTLKTSCCYLDLGDMAELCRNVEVSANKGLAGNSEVSILMQRLEKAYDLNRH